MRKRERGGQRAARASVDRHPRPFRHVRSAVDGEGRRGRSESDSGFSFAGKGVCLRRERERAAVPQHGSVVCRGGPGGKERV